MDWQSESYSKVNCGTVGDSNTIKQDSYARVNLMTCDDFNEHLAFTVNAHTCSTRATSAA